MLEYLVTAYQITDEFSEQAKQQFPKKTGRVSLNLIPQKKVISLILCTGNIESVILIEETAEVLKVILKVTSATKLCFAIK